ncbi:hypothetical protein D477_011371 [Arthrobacter crystallopoietes BAB-32]|uniref:Hpt domain-containing protein n=1 Tax=Arthrobacter crystallopoietes BAB-32 TaxID=1246476 RepID=N1V256_9MICC|nr:hypothetical protein [Arthrobacter crystallopoietes]EMY34089.1 hypothetical protein D477_011371 [Arthrobacter crystallopoietes BAB-32]
MPAHISGQLTLVSREIFDTFQEELQDPGICYRYLLDYLRMWDWRYLRLSRAVRAGDAETAMDAILSANSSARMVGALRLAALAAEFEQRLKEGGIPAVVPLLGGIAMCGQLTMAEIRRNLPINDDGDRAHDGTEDIAAATAKPQTPGLSKTAERVFNALAIHLPFRLEPGH